MLLGVEDLAPFAEIPVDKALMMIADASALATLAAPCLTDATALSQVQQNAALAVLRGAILRWHEAGSGALQSEAENIGTYGFSKTFDTRQQRKQMFWPSEIVQLQSICGGLKSGGAFAVDTTPGWMGVVHLDTCSVNFGGGCSCGALLLSGLLP